MPGREVNWDNLERDFLSSKDNGVLRVLSRIAS